MFKFFKGLLKSESGPLTIQYHKIPEWLAAEEGILDAELKSATSSARVTLEQAIRDLQSAADDLSDAEVDAEVHAKLGKIVQSSLPLFVRALNASISRTLPEDPEAFYAAAVEMLKGALKSMSGQGRYLRAAFPEGMREIRTTLDVFGREINTLSEKFSAVRSQKALLEEIKRIHADLNAARITHATLLERQKAAIEDAALHAERLSDAQEQLEHLRRDAGYASVGEIREQLKQVTLQLGSLEREYHAVAAPLSRISTKAQKVASRQGEKPVEKTMGNAVDALQAFPQVQESDLIQAVEDAVPLLLQKLDAHAVELKSREERDLFAHPDQIARRVGELLKQYQSCASRRDGLQRQLETHPVLAQERDLEAGIRQIEERREADVRFLDASPGEIDRLMNQRTALESALCRSVARRTNRQVVLEIDGRKESCAPG